jgi:hypothetical protein
MAVRYCWIKILLTLCKHVPCNTLTHSTNEDLLNIKYKCDPEVSYPLSYVRYHWNPEPACKKSHFVSLFYLYWYFKIYQISSDILTRIFVSTWKLTFEILYPADEPCSVADTKTVRSLRLNETRFGPKKKASPIYLGPKNLDTFWCAGWAWNCQIIFRFASIHGHACFILLQNVIYIIKFYLNGILNFFQYF